MEVMFMDSIDIDSSNSAFVDSGVWEFGFVKSDVSDFGVLLIELIIGKESIQINNYPNNLNESLVDWITHLLTSFSDVYSVVDKSLIGRGFDCEIFQFFRIAFTCLKPFPGQRPTMLELYNTISIFGKRYSITNDFEILSQYETATANTLYEIAEISQMQRMITKMSFTEISEATGNFNTNIVIGFGKIGMMYKVVLPNCWPLAIKRLHNCQSYEKQFLSELSTLVEATGNFNTNIVIGFGKIGMMYKVVLPNCWPLAIKRLHNCQSYEKQFLSELSTLGEGEHKDKILDWPLRAKIATRVARGLAWPHHKYDFQVVHLNLGSKSLLLDKNFEPKISNFGGAKISSFGGVMFTNSNVTMGVIDNSLIDRGFDGEIIELLRIACTCLNPFPSQRPTMLELYNTISTFGERDGITNDSEILMQPKITIASSSNEIVEVEIAQTH
nr:putative inactive leucine-rich repeat receptor-like protein kinase [Quercus suber]